MDLTNDMKRALKTNSCNLGAAAFASQAVDSMNHFHFQYEAKADLQKRSRVAERRYVTNRVMISRSSGTLPARKLTKRQQC